MLNRKLKQLQGFLKSSTKIKKNQLKFKNITSSIFKNGAG